MSYFGSHALGSVTINDAFDAALIENVAVKEGAFRAATAIAARIRQMAPVRTGTYLASIGVQEFRGGARVISTDPIAHILEFGAPNRGIVGRFFFHRAAESLGFKFKAHR